MTEMDSKTDHIAVTEESDIDETILIYLRK